MPEIVVRLPGPTERGFLRRVQEASVFRDRIEANDWKAMLDFADYLIAHSYVEVPDSALEGVEPVKDADGRVIEAPPIGAAKAAARHHDGKANTQTSNFMAITGLNRVMSGDGSISWRIEMWMRLQFVHRISRKPASFWQLGVVL